jgi:hypothetical protein
MHVLHQAPPSARRAVLALVVAAVSAVALTLAIAPGLNGLSSSSTPAGAPAANAAVNTSAVSLPTGNPFAHGRVTGPFTTPIRLPWAAAAHWPSVEATKR